MKLESLNNPKYSLTPEKMGELVGGKQVTESTGAGRVHYSGTNYWTNYSCDTLFYSSEDDYRHNITTREIWGSAADPSYRTDYVRNK